MGLLRMYLATSVVNWHAEGPKFDFFWINGLVAVLCFYMLSGFLIAMVLNERYRGPGAIRRFYAARAGRIFPIYLVVLITTMILMWALDAPNPFYEQDMTATKWLFVVASNAGILGLDVYKFWPGVVTEQMKIVPIAFTLSIELQFYLAAPFIVMRRLRYVALVTAALLALRFAVPTYGKPELWHFYFSPTVWCFFFLGVLSYRLSVLFSIRSRAALTVVSFVAVIAAIKIGDPHAYKDLDQPELWVFYLAFAAAIPYLFALTKKSRIDAVLGDLSYPIYLTHLTVGAVLGYAILAGWWSWPANISSFRIIVYITVAVSVLLLLVEAPARRWIKGRALGSNPTERQTEPSPLLSS